MTGLSELKEQIREEASSNPDKFFATEVIKEKGFSRGQCNNCGKYFWSFKERQVCGEPECGDGYTFINDSPTTKEYSYIESWELFRDFMEDRKYTPIDRYPVVARWRGDVEFVGGSIYNFQPYVVSGEAEPPAPELVVPQPSLRFNDIDNVGVTGRHYVLHNHIGQTCFREADEYDQDRYFRDMFEFAVESLGIPKEKLILHEDAWGGGGNLGACMEFFVDGLELWNQVYMFYEQTPNGYEELDLKVLDMGMGQERITWISHGTETSYECVMPDTLKKMKKKTDIQPDKQVWEDFLPHSSKLNIDEVDDIDEKWREIADEIGLTVEELKEEIKPTAALYSVAEHCRALLFALNDGKIPSNTGGGHNLRIVYRRAREFIEKYDWNLDMKEVVEWNAEELEPMFPELTQNLDDVKKIIKVEEKKWERSKEKAEKELNRLEEQPSVEKMIELYESHGVSAQMMENAGFNVPEDFYSMVTEEDEEIKEVEEEFDTSNIQDTELLFYEDENREEMDAEVLMEKDGWVALDRTVFYPEGGGQEADHGFLEAEDEKFTVEDTQKQGNVVFHYIGENHLEPGDKIHGWLNWDRRFQLMQHHTATHAVNGAAKDLLGNHIWQAGSHKSMEKGRLDVTHYEKLTLVELDQLEEKVREIIWSDFKVKKKVMPKKDAEAKFGFRIYQGGAVPGNEIRIVTIEDDGDIKDVEACGGTHLESTGEINEFVVTGSKRIQDGVIRLEYKAGTAAEEYIESIRERVEKVADLLNVSVEGNHREIQRDLVEIFSIEEDHLVDTVENFLEENDELHHKIVKLANYLEEDVEMPGVEGETLVEKNRSLFNCWKEREKLVESLQASIESKLKQVMDDRVVEEEVPTENIGLLIRVTQKLAREYEASVTVVAEKGAISASYHENYNADENLEKYAEDIQGDENFAKSFKLKQKN